MRARRARLLLRSGGSAEIGVATNSTSLAIWSGALRPGNVHSADGWREVEGMGYAIRLPANRVLQEKIGYDMSSSAWIPG